jgi:ABC-type transport system involved in multi-copper enzyme maturation permease subunit
MLGFRRGIVCAELRLCEKANMLPGPVFHAELMTTARRRRFYAARFVYGLVLLFLVWQYGPASLTPADTADGVLSISQMARLGRILFQTFAITQGIAVVFFTPVLVAGVIADERQRKTLQYLLASRLSSGEIVVGKLAARLLHVGVLITLGVPVQMMLGLFGGVSPESVAIAYVTTCSGVVFLAALSVLVSTYARRPRDAFSLVFMLMVVWMMGPTFVAAFMPAAGPPWIQIYAWIRPINDWAGSSSPVYVLSSGYINPMGSIASFRAFAWMIGLQLAYSALFVVWSVARLRPVARKDGEVRGWFGRRARTATTQRWRPRRECGHDAMLWKERYVSRTSRATRIVATLVLGCVVMIIGYFTYTFAKPAFAELAAHGFGSDIADVRSGSSRQEFNAFLRAMATLVYLGWTLGITSAAASGITSEREADTWLSLTSTPLDGWEIVRAKMFGAVWTTRGLGVMLLILLGTGLVSGAIHPFGVAAFLVLTAIYLWFAVALGTYLSLIMRTTMRATATMIGLILLLNGGYLLGCVVLDPDTLYILAGVTPYTEAVSLMDYKDFWDVVHSGSERRIAETVGTCVASALAYALAALILTLLAAAGFDAWIDRPRRALSDSASSTGSARESALE